MYWHRISELLMDWWIGQGLSPCLERIVDCLGIEIGLAFWSRIALWGSCNGKLEIGIFHFLERNISGIFGHG